MGKFCKTYKIAEKNIAICSEYEDVHKLCHGYETTEKADFEVNISPQDIEYENYRGKMQDKKNKIPVRKYTDGYLETLAVYRKIAEKLIENDIILFHGSAVAVDGECYLFTALSGTGKSTHTRLWREYFGERAVMVNDDKPLLRISDNNVIVYGTPWNGKHSIGENISVPLKALCLLQRSKENHIERVDGHSAYHLILQQAYRSADGDKIEKLLVLIDKIISKVPVYMLGCNMDISAVKTAYTGMKG